MKVRTALPFLALALALPVSLEAREFSKEDLVGRQAFVTAPLVEARWSVGSHGRLELGAFEARGALTFDGVGGVVGFRLVWGRSHASEASPTEDDYQDHRQSPLRQELTGTYDVSPDGVVTMTWEVDPPRLFEAVTMRRVGTQRVRAQEEVQGILGPGGRVDGFFTVVMEHDYPEDICTESVQDFSAGRSFPFQTMGVDRPAPLMPRLRFTEAGR